jgi:hypothetical protein
MKRLMECGVSLSGCPDKANEFRELYADELKVFDIDTISFCNCFKSAVFSFGQGSIFSRLLTMVGSLAILIRSAN